MMMDMELQHRPVKGIYLERAAYRLHVVEGTPPAEWTLISHNLEATPNQCRRVLREVLTLQELAAVDWSAVRRVDDAAA
jgi:hypothetical protein